MIATIAVLAVCALIGGAAFQTRKAQAKTTSLGASGADLLDAGTVANLRIIETSLGGVVTNITADGVDVRDRNKKDHQIRFAPGATLIDQGVKVSASVIEPGDHISALGLNGGATFAAYKVHIYPHHVPVGGTITVQYDRNTFELENRKHKQTNITVSPSAIIINGHRRWRLQDLKINTHLQGRAVRNPILDYNYVVDYIKVLVPPTTQHVGGTIMHVDQAHGLVTIYSKTLHQNYTIEITPKTKVTLSKWSADYSDMSNGDHISVTGLVDTSGKVAGPNPIIAGRIRISSLGFGGAIASIAVAPNGGRVLTIKKNGHLLRIDVPGQAVVSYGGQQALVPDIVMNEKIHASGTRIGKYELLARSITIYPRQHTVSGVVESILPGQYRILNTSTNQQYIIHVTAVTKFTLNGAPTTALSVRVGRHIRVRGVDTLHSAEKAIPTMDAAHVSISVHVARPKHTTHKKTKSKKTTTSSASTATPTPRSRAAAVA